MNTSEVRRRTLRYERKKRFVLDVDLNVPPNEAEAVEGTSTVTAAAHAESSQLSRQTVVVQRHVGSGSGSGGSGVQQPAPAPAPAPAATIDVEAIDDEVVISSPRRFAEAKKKKRSRHNNGPIVLDQVSHAVRGNSVEEITRPSLNDYIARTSNPNWTYIDLEINNNAKRETMKKSQEQVQSIPPPPKEPTFSCAVCLCPLVEETSTKCGHIFCKKCIKAAVTKQGKCPTCRRKTTMKDIIRVYLPTAS